jgi:hypothetical protein
VGSVVNILLQTRLFPALDIDVANDALASSVEDRARDFLGFAPVRFRAGSARRLMLYRLEANHPPIRKIRVPFVMNGERQAVELLGAGCQCVIEGIHPSGSLYQWREWHPCELGPHGLTEINSEHVRRFFA